MSLIILISKQTKHVQYNAILFQAALALFGMLGGPSLGLFALGVFFPQANSKVRSAL